MRLPKRSNKLGLQFVFQLPDLGADGGLRAITRLRSFGEALQPDDLEKRVELIKIHRLSRGEKTGVAATCDDCERILSSTRFP